MQRTEEVAFKWSVWCLGDVMTMLTGIEGVFIDREETVRNRDESKKISMLFAGFKWDPVTGILVKVI